MAKKTTTKKTTAKTVTKTAVKPKKLSAVDKPMTKGQILTSITDLTGVTKKDVTLILASIETVIEAHMKKGAAGIFILPGLLKIQLARKPATKARKGVNPFTGAEMMIKAKPARNVVKVKALKKLKEMV
jgi:nucleoid DNA-binding protein